MFSASRPAELSLAPSLAIVKAASDAVQPLVPDWKLPFGSSCPYRPARGPRAGTGAGQTA